jgi:hypothetical protein
MRIRGKGLGGVHRDIHLASFLFLLKDQNRSDHFGASTHKLAHVLLDRYTSHVHRFRMLLKLRLERRWQDDFAQEKSTRSNNNNRESLIIRFASESDIFISDYSSWSARSLSLTLHLVGSSSNRMAWLAELYSLYSPACSACGSWSQILSRSEGNPCP